MKGNRKKGLHPDDVGIGHIRKKGTSFKGKHAKLQDSSENGTGRSVTFKG